MKAAYEIIAKLRTPSINPGDTAIIEIFISGYGCVTSHKLVASYASSLINKEDPGIVRTSIQWATDTTTGQSAPIAGKGRTYEHKIDHVGAVIYLHQGYFADIPNNTYNKEHIPHIMPENNWDGLAPITFEMNTSKRVTAGDYQIDIVFTYSDGTEFRTDHKVVVVHIKDWNERYAKLAWMVGIIIAAIALPFLPSIIDHIVHAFMPQ